MAESSDELSDAVLKDPVFQLNAAIWLVRVPPGAPVIGRECWQGEGLVLRSVGLKLGTSAESSAAHRKAFDVNPSAPVPDLIFRHMNSSFQMAIECKASSFSMESTTATQLRKLLHYCSQSNVAFGVNAPAIVSYLLPDSESAAQRRTLKLASEELRDKNLAFSESATIGILFSNHGLEARFISVEDPVERPWLGLARRDWCVYPGEGPVRPLYFIPFDPASASEQSAEERGYCEKLLTERILTAAVSEIGRAIIPDNVTLISRDLVGTATYNVSDRWAKSDSVQLETRVTNILASIFRRAKVAAEKVERKQDGLELFLASEKDRSAMIDILLKAQPAAISPALHDPQQDAAEPGSGGWLDASGDDPSE